MTPLESDIERRFVSQLKVWGITVIKLNLQGRCGWPDRQVILPGGRVLFVEFKRPGEELEPLQRHVHRQLRSLGHAVETFDDAEEALEYVKRTIEPA